MDHAHHAAVLECHEHPRSVQTGARSQPVPVRRYSGNASEKTLSLADEEDLRRVIGSVREGLEELVLAYPSMLHRLRDIMLAELQVPNVSPQSLAEMRERAENIRQLAGDFRLDAFVGRLAQFDGSDESFEGISSLAANKPPRDWVDPDLDHAAIELADMAQKFLRAETYARVKGRPDKRQAMAVVIGMDGRPAPLLEEFDIADSDRAGRQRSHRASRRCTGGSRHQPPQHHSGGAGGTQHARYMQKPLRLHKGSARREEPLHDDQTVL